MSARELLKIPIKYSKNLAISQVFSSSFFRSGTEHLPPLGGGKIIFFHIAVEVADVAVSVSECRPAFYFDGNLTARKGNIKRIIAWFKPLVFVTEATVRVAVVEDLSKFGIFIGGHFVYLKGNSLLASLTANCCTRH